ncbi:hypothetical protein DESHY_20100 [Desulforamulus hydrothermalis Lam5 = DSM 18033]|uniref:Uncharacterized protein n=1 Tax=Desulforamulus hydrothermalis Lam5 = DSM 18033 TaxID=1121428 RepID=K8EHX3_9FIRM|nr:hypothetical protein DESHY_20100 [Desulforamulus hydrothermalis Lam5 = DSM 18033]
MFVDTLKACFRPYYFGLYQIRILLQNHKRLDNISPLTEALQQFYNYHTYYGNYLQGV